MIEINELQTKIKKKRGGRRRRRKRKLAQSCNCPCKKRKGKYRKRYRLVTESPQSVSPQKNRLYKYNHIQKFPKYNQAIQYRPKTKKIAPGTNPVVRSRQPNHKLDFKIRGKDLLDLKFKIDI